MRSRGLALATLLVLLSPLACDDNTAPYYPDTGGSDKDLGPANPDGSCPLSLAAASAQTVNLDVGLASELAVRLTDCKSTPVSAQVLWQIAGDGGGSTLAASSTATDASGFAKVKLTAGNKSASFKVLASYEALSPVEFNVTVTLKPLGTIVVTMAYSGKRAFTEYTAMLLTNQACASLDPFTLPTALMQATPVAQITAQPTFTDVPVGSYVVAVVAKEGAEVSGFGCLGEVKVEAGQTTTAAVTILDLPVVFNGTYLLDNQFDLTSALPPSFANTVKILYELYDDHELYNDNNGKGNDQYGLDPAAFLLDFVYRQFCRWECASGQDFSSCSQTNHEKGDLKALYMQSFQTWGPCEPTFPTLCGALDLPIGVSPTGAPSYVYTWLNDQVQKEIVKLVPAIIQNLGQLFSDLSSAFTKLHIKSKMTTVDVGLHNTPGTFEHILETMVITIHDLNGVASTKEFKLADAGVSNLSYTGLATTKDDKLQIPKHSFQLEFGKLAVYIYKNVLLKALGFTSTGQMFQSWVNCTQVGTWINQQIALLPAATAAQFCNLGLQAAGDWVEGEIQKSISTGAKFELTAGTCEAGLPLGPKRLAMKLVNGQWTGVITDGPFTGPFTGTFTGQRQ